MLKHINEHFKEIYYTKRLNNGLNIVILPKEHYHTTYVSLSVPFGNHHTQLYIDNQLITLPIGSAHFFEHKIYASEQGDMFAKFVKYGIEPNAYTSYEYTSYIFNATSHVKEGIQLLFETLDKPYFTDENIDTERDIINEEIHMNDDKTSTKMYRHLFESMFFNHPIKHDILGTKESIALINKDTLHLMHQYFYQTSNRLLVIAGKVDIEDIESFLSSYDTKEHIYPFELIPIQEPKEIVTEEKEVFEHIEKPRLALGFKFKHQFDIVQMELVSTALYIVLHAYIGQSSKHFQSLLDEKLIYNDLHYFVQKEAQAESVIIYASSPNPKELKKRLIEILNQPIEDVLTEAVFKRLNNVTLAASIEALDDMENKTYMFTNYALDHLDLFEVMEKKLSITYMDAIQAYKEFQSSNLAVIYMFPKTKS